MTDIALVDDRMPSRPSAPSRSALIARTLADIRSRYIEPSQAFARLQEAWPRMLTVTVVDIVVRNGDGLLEPRCEPERLRWLRRAMYDLEGLAPTDEILRVGAISDELHDAPFDKSRTRALVGFMVDAFPNARPHEPMAYVETLISELEADALPPAAIAVACNKIVREATFLPAPAEVLKKAKDAQAWQRHAAHLSKIHVRDRARLEAIVEELAAMTDLPAEPRKIDFGYRGSAAPPCESPNPALNPHKEVV